MHDIQRETAMRAIKMLEAVGVQFSVIVDGTAYGNIKVKPQYKRGETHKYYWSKMEDMAPGDVVYVDAGDFDISVLASNISSAGIRAWGKGSTVIKSDKDANTVAVLRIF